MEPIKFGGMNEVFAEDQSDYIPLPVFKGANGGKVCLCQSTFNQALQPVNLWIDNKVRKIDDD